MSTDETEEIRSYLKRIETALIGDESLGHVGLVTRMKSVEVTVNQIQRERSDEQSKRKGATMLLATLSSVAAVVGSATTWILTNLNRS